MSLLFVVCFSFAVLLQSPTKWYMKLVPVSQLMSATLFHLCIHSDRLHSLLPPPSSLLPPLSHLPLSWLPSILSHVCINLWLHCYINTALLPPLLFRLTSVPLCCIHVIYCTVEKRRVEFLLMWRSLTEELDTLGESLKRSQGIRPNK